MKYYVIIQKMKFLCLIDQQGVLLHKIRYKRVCMNVMIFTKKRLLVFPYVYMYIFFIPLEEYTEN